MLAEWVEARKFPTTRLRPGYEEEEVDAFLDAIRDTFLGIREPSLTPAEIRIKQFSTTRLRPGYRLEEVDAFLDAAEVRLAARASARGHAARQRSVAADPAAGAAQIRCLECGAQSAETTEVCARCRAPVAGPVAQYLRRHRVLSWAGLILGFFICVLLLFNGFAPSQGRGDNPAAAVLGCLGLGLCILLTIYLRLISSNGTALDEQSSSRKTRTT
jgi:DivIVA domain-containing protein